MAESRTKNTKRNLVSGLIKQASSIILPFFVRTIILYVLGEQYQGLSSLFTSILQVLNLTDLGFSSAVVYILYKPIAEEDHETICAIIEYLKKVYKIVGFVILALGLSLMPFLPLLIKGSWPDDINIYLLYAIYLFNAVISYWLFAYKSALLNAMQRVDVVNNISTVTQTALKLLQIAVLLLFRNYYVYISFLPVVTIINNLMLEGASRKYFPQIIPQGRIPADVRQNLVKQVKGIMINRIGDVARNGADNIFLSALLGLTAVAIYNNYFYIYSALYGISLVIANSMGASVGDSIARETSEKNYKDMCKFTFVFSWFTGWCAICMCCLYQPFMVIWMRGNMSLVLPDYDMILFCIYFYAITMNNIRNQYLNGAGLYWELRVWYTLEAVGNIVLNYALGYFFGITGIITATLITIVLFNFIARTNVLFKNYFHQSPREYYLQHLLYIATGVIGCAATYAVCSGVRMGGIAGLIVKAGICVIIPNLIFLLAYCKTKRFQESVLFAEKILIVRNSNLPHR